MKKFKAISLLLSIVLVIFIALTGCGEKELTKVTVAEVTHSVFYAPQYVALTEGFFEEEGLEVEFVNTKGADKTMTALLSNQADIGFMGPEASVYVYNQGKEDYAVNFAQLTQRDGSFLMGREKTANFDFNMLKGKTIIGGRKGGMPEMTLEYVIRKHGLEPGKDVTVRTDIQFAVMAGAFKGGEGDYVTLFEPTATMLEKEGAGYIVASIGEEGGYIPYTCYSAKKSYIEKNPEIIQAFTNGIYKGMKWVEGHSPEEIAKSLQPHFPDADLEILTALVERYKVQDTWKPDLILTEEGLNHMMDIIDQAIGLDARAPYEKIVNTEFAEKAMKK
ncbi:ABC transporter substrate-binding protein [Paramaledivibacter caminithermalis]|jgi:NitT/TauT family transport system substrate-binding protein|uniref:NitT/TauT family transport system substrate-binding protein n=1 Tax=Paramaledivibacter caminithermalis (strain DSM 15212 / CIP 107654 / DViRD3) TaxID=1121301 RepID=A0A1M6LE75_PARC5|nr:ABC transporter substrate-binding protein [Paramaledivibacter caminithermalis]SHJ69504.1 NitT/TauT family transport system substrate-binding protein [Paramaledivibacter caminithermalis DSM 15212]